MKLEHLELCGQNLILHPMKAAFWQEASLLLLADLHLGKITHFRREGVPVPPAAMEKNWSNLRTLLEDFAPPRVLFLGDLFHSTINSEWPYFLDFLNDFSHTSFELIRGNHDILPTWHYDQSQLILHEHSLIEPPFVFSHEPLEEWPAHLYNMAGHIHPAVRLKGKGRQTLTLPCFYFGNRQGILPAFGAFTGTAVIQPREGDKIYALTGDAMVKTSS